jgi:hypothetical protein
MTSHTTHVDVTADDGIVAGAALRLLRLEGATITAGALIAYSTTHKSWWLIPVMFLLQIRPGQEVDRVVALDVFGHRPFDLRPNAAETRNAGRLGPPALRE